MRARAYAGKRRKLEGKGGCRDGKDLLSNVSNRVRISVEGGKERQHKIHKTTQLQTMAHAQTYTQTTNTRATEHGTMSCKST